MVRAVASRLRTPVSLALARSPAIPWLSARITAAGPALPQQQARHARRPARKPAIPSYRDGRDSILRDEPRGQNTPVDLPPDFLRIFESAVPRPGAQPIPPELPPQHPRQGASIGHPEFADDTKVAEPQPDPPGFAPGSLPKPPAPRIPPGDPFPTLEPDGALSSEQTGQHDDAPKSQPSWTKGKGFMCGICHYRSYIVGRVWVHTIKTHPEPPPPESTPVDAFFAMYDGKFGFSYDRNLPPSYSFNALRTLLMRYNDQIDMVQVRALFGTALRAELAQWLGGHEAYAMWRFHRALAIEGVPSGRQAFWKRYKDSYVNLIDLIHWCRHEHRHPLELQDMRFPPPKVIDIYESAEALREYSLATGKTFPRECDTGGVNWYPDNPVVRLLQRQVTTIEIDVIDQEELAPLLPNAGLLRPPKPLFRNITNNQTEPLAPPFPEAPPPARFERPPPPLSARERAMAKFAAHLDGMEKS